MRTAVFALLLFGCRTQPFDHPFTDDFGTITGTPHDMAVTTTIRDLSVQPTGMGCAALLSCISTNCQDNQCTNCFNAASQQAQQLYGVAVNCGYSWCLTRQGKTPPRCTQLPDGTIDDPPDGGVGECNQCVTNVFAELGGYQCVPIDDPDCNPMQCQDATVMCLNN